MKKIILSVLVFVICFSSMYFQFSVKCKDCKNRVPNPAITKLHDQAQTGDIILVSSADFFSNMIANIDKCHFSSAKPVYKTGDDIMLIVSDTANLADASDGLYLAPFNEYLKGYDSIKIALYRPKEFSDEYKQNMEKVVKLAGAATFGKFMTYDLAFNNDDMTTVNCAKVLLMIYEDSLLDRRNEKVWPINSTLPCDVKLKNLIQIGDWVSYWE